ncbi:MAG: sulfite exporter TauE/SafE family protein [Alphaproteobacteria bacterium]|nr:sulfite exporter TauE/SafE family protein [Alphaproteobacteria bacterium]
MTIDVAGVPVTALGLGLALLGLALGGWVKGLIGLGLPMAALPLLTHVVGLKGAISLLSVSIIAVNIWQAIDGGHLPSMLRRFWPVALAMAIGIGVGTWALKTIDPQPLYAVAGIAVLLALASNLFRPDIAISPDLERWIGPIAGALAGLLGGVSSLFGPPLVIFLVGLKLTKDEFVAAIALLYLLGGIPLLFGLMFQGIMGGEALVLSVLAMLPVAAGMLIGQRLRARLDGPRFTKLILAFMAFLAFSLIAKSI